MKRFLKWLIMMLGLMTIKEYDTFVEENSKRLRDLQSKHHEEIRNLTESRDRLLIENILRANGVDLTPMIDFPTGRESVPTRVAVEGKYQIGHSPNTSVKVFEFNLERVSLERDLERLAQCNYDYDFGVHNVFYTYHGMFCRTLQGLREADRRRKYDQRRRHHE